jgi:hypothetical protein
MKILAALVYKTIIQILRKKLNAKKVEGDTYN